MRFHVIMLKTLKDLFSLKRSVLFILITLLLPIVASKLFESHTPVRLSLLTLPMETQMVVAIFIISTFIWLAGIPLTILSSITCGDFISKEYQEGTLLLLVSKPVKRYEIIVGKFLAFLLNSLVLESIVLISSPLILYYLLNLDVYILEAMIRLVPWLMLYSMFVTFVFGCMATALSTIFNSRIKVLVVMVTIIILVYFGFGMIRSWTEPSGVYEKYGISYLDMNYHLGNSYLFFLKRSHYRMIPLLQGILGRFTGTYESVAPEKVYDKDIGAMPSSLEVKEYMAPLTSLVTWFMVSSASLVFGTLYFQKKEVY